MLLVPVRQHGRHHSSGAAESLRAGAKGTGEKGQQGKGVKGGKGAKGEQGLSAAAKRRARAQSYLDLRNVRQAYGDPTLPSQGCPWGCPPW